MVSPEPEITSFGPPDIHIDFAPLETDLDYALPSGHASLNAGALSPPDRSKLRDRIRARSDPFSALSRSTSDRVRAKSDSGISHRDYILDLADPGRLPPIAEGEESGVASGRASKHPATFQCTLCPKRFTRAYNLRSHLRTHTDERPFVCSVCGKAYARQHDRKRHEGLHAGEKKFVCKGDLKDGSKWGCGRRFARADALGRHFRSEAGRVCIQSLLEEEAKEEKSSSPVLSGSGVPNTVDVTRVATSAPGDDSKQTRKRRRLYAGISMGPPSPPLGPLKPFHYDLPPGLLKQYPALASIQWDQLPSVQLPDDFNDSGYSGSGRSSFDTESGELFENDVNDFAGLSQEQQFEYVQVVEGNYTTANQSQVTDSASNQDFVPNGNDIPPPIVSGEHDQIQQIGTKFSSNAASMDSTMSAHIFMKQALLDQNDEDKVLSFADQARHPVSSNGHDSPVIANLHGLFTPPLGPQIRESTLSEPSFSVSQSTIVRRPDNADISDEEVVPSENVTSMLKSHQIWNKLANSHEFENGTIDIDNLCSELRSKARSSETGVVVDHKDVAAALERLPSDRVPPTRTNSDALDQEKHPQFLQALEANKTNSNDVSVHRSHQLPSPDRHTNEIIGASSTESLHKKRSVFTLLDDDSKPQPEAKTAPIVTLSSPSTPSIPGQLSFKEGSADDDPHIYHQTSYSEQANTGSANLKRSNGSEPAQVATHGFPQPLFSDSGYHSGLGTDTESVCSLRSVGSSLGLPQNFLQEFIAFFGDVLIERAGARAWADYALAHHSPEDIERRLNALLKRYTENLSNTASKIGPMNNAKWSETKHGGEEIQSKAQTRHQFSQAFQILDGATKLVRRYRPKIARYFCDKAVSEPVTEISLASRLQALSRQLSLTEKLGLFDKTTSTRRDPTEASNDVLMDDDVDELFANIEGIRDLLVSSEAFEHLAADLRRTLYCGDIDVMDRIGTTVVNGSKSKAPKHVLQVVFVVDWSLPSFMESQYDGDFTRIGSVVTLSGSALYAQATTCLEYAKAVWPSTGYEFIAAIESMVPHTGQNGPYTHYNGLLWRIARSTPIEDGLRVSASGPTSMVVELAQQLAWIGSALSSSPYGEQLAYCRPSVSLSGDLDSWTSDGLFRISFQHEPLHPTENACWLPMFCGASIAYGFPIPKRGEETGLEIPLQLMAGIAGIRHAVEYDGGVVMKGFSTMFVPTKKAGNRVQWHLISSDDVDTRLSYQEGLSGCNDRLSTKDLSLADLSKCRAIVGWCTAATSLLGSECANYENIDYSGAEDADTPLKFAGGTLGFQQFGVAQLDFNLGAKDGKSHFQRSGPFQRIVSAASRTPVVLFDTAERRAWLVPASNVLLHIAQHRHWLEPFEVNGKRVSLPKAGADCSSAKELLLKNATMSLSDYEEYTFKDLILGIWANLEFLIDQNVMRERANPGASVKGTLRESISGFEFKAVVEERSPFRQKQVIIRKTCGGWPMLARDIDALVLFANGFEDLIRPRKDDTENLCNLWRSVPKWKDYLATSVSTVKDLYDVAGCRLDRKYLTSSRLQWDRGNSVVFDACKSPGSYRCRCNRLQQIVPKSAIGTIVPPGQLVDDGAVIFGHSGSLIQDAVARTAPRSQIASGIYSQPNVSLTPIIVRPDEDDVSVTSDDEPSGRSGSDTTIGSFPSSITSFASREGVTPALDELKIEPGETPCSRKRVREPNETSPFDGQRQTTFRETSPKRMKQRNCLDSSPGSWSDEDEEFIMRSLAETTSSLKGLRNREANRHLRHDSGA